MKSDLNPTIYILDEYELPSCPSIMLLDVNLDIEIDTLGLWYIEELRMEDAKGKTLSFKQGDWLFDLLVADVYKDEKLCDLINYQCIEA
jgi:hypothetical protein